MHAGGVVVKLDRFPLTGRVEVGLEDLKHAVCLARPAVAAGGGRREGRAAARTVLPLTASPTVVEPPLRSSAGQPSSKSGNRDSGMQQCHSLSVVHRVFAQSVQVPHCTARSAGLLQGEQD